MAEEEKAIKPILWMFCSLLMTFPYDTHYLWYFVFLLQCFQTFSLCDCPEHALEESNNNRRRSDPRCKSGFKLLMPDFQTGGAPSVLPMAATFHSLPWIIPLVHVPKHVCACKNTHPEAWKPQQTNGCKCTCTWRNKVRSRGIWTFTYFFFPP